MIEIPNAAIKHFQFIVLGIWPINALTLWARGHEWGWDKTPQDIMGLWEWGIFVSFSLAISVELGVKMFFALAQERRRREREQAEARAEGRRDGHAEGLIAGHAEALALGRQEIREETLTMLDVLSDAAERNPALLPFLLTEYRIRFENGPATV